MQRRDFLIKKILFALLTLVVVIFFNFFLFRILPGDPVKLIIHSPRMTKEAQQKIRENFGLDKPVWWNEAAFEERGMMGGFDTQFSAYLTNLSKGDLGISFANRQEVSEVISDRVWKTVLLIGIGEGLAVLFGIALGMLAAWRRGTQLDTNILLFGLFTWAMPTFFFGIILLMLAGGRFPIGGMVTPGIKPEDGMKYWWDVGHHLVLPTITLAVLYMSEYLLIMRSSVVEVLSEDFILTAKAKGLNTARIFKDHALKNAMLPMVTIIALTLGYTVGGAIQVETVFSWPGLGRFMFEAVQKRDYPVLQGVFLLLAVSVVLANLVADLFYAVLDPRVKPE